MNEVARLGGTALLRVAGMPLDAWAAAGNPRLCARVAEQAGQEERRAGHARALAARLGATVVPHPDLAPADRRAVLALRRRLHRGAAPGPADCRLLDRLPGAESLAAQARLLCHEAESAAAALPELDRAVSEERERVAALGWSLLSEDPVMAAFVEEAEPGLAADVARRLAAGGSWSEKPLRKRGAYLWRALGRAAAKTTPRGWAGQAALLPVGPPCEDGGEERVPRLLAAGTVLGAVAAEAVENVHLLRARLADSGLRAADPTTSIAPAPLYFLQTARPGSGTGVLRCWVIDPGGGDRMREVVLRRTRPLESVLALLADGPRPLEEVEAALLGTAAVRAAPGRDVLRGFLAHLLDLGVLQVCAAPRRRLSGWTGAEEVRVRGVLPHPVPDVPAAGPRLWFTDSYRSVTTSVPAAAAEHVQRALGIAARVAWLRDADRTAAPDGRRSLPPELEGLGERPCPLGEILLRHLSDGYGPPGPPQTRRHHTGWHPATTSGSGYAGLLDHLAGHAGDEQVDLDDGLLDALGAPPARTALPPWPLDCLLRPLRSPGPLAVLETASPAGVLDARFAAALDTLHGAYPNADGYRAFLAAVERLSGARFVELLVPPLAERAANAVRRPVLTGWWTGDPDPAPYHGPAGPAARHLPLDRITLRRDGRQVVAEADGQRLLPVHHATRTPLPPYDVLLRLLLAAGHPAASRVVRLDGLTEALPGAHRVPRVTVDGTLVVSPAGWRVSRELLWRPGDSDLAKVRALTGLRRDAGLPRFAFVRTAAGARPVPVDFAALTAVPLLERLCAHQPGADLLVEEMLPGPDGLLLRDPLHGGAAVAAQLLLRLPAGRGAEELAALAAAALRGTPGVPGAPAPSGRGTGAVPNQHRS
ncbi:lantibiotic dehydratase [Streptomyces sp. NEAU-sy36]|uniref:lantibiotic dehydratase n=1 Tax=unclassified Streptomyces TaxID=2593676 RepID=UPI0015D5BE04|nr:MULTISPECIES: lantibiotic dehydratase [unclassified Streptomyces]QLJ02736.1 lantibiotic dehydratase [Streptomyces sp. NEAU-sy36]